MRRQRRQREVWRALGRDDADWGVLTASDRRFGGWGDGLEAFYASGRAEVDACLALAKPPGRTRALDYGAGTGRLTFALASAFESVTSLDVSDGMLRTLQQRAEARSIGNIAPVLVDAYSPAADHDFAISLLVLQHLPDRESVQHAIALIASALHNHGTAVLEIPTRALSLRARLQPRLRVYSVVRGLGIPPDRLHRWGFSGISMLTIDEESAQGMFTACGFEVVGSTSTRDSGHEYARWVLRRTAP